MIINAPIPPPINAPTIGTNAVIPTKVPIIGAYGNPNIFIPIPHKLPKIIASIV